MTVHDEMLLFAFKNLFEMDSMQCIRGSEFKCVFYLHEFYHGARAPHIELEIRPNM